MPLRHRGRDLRPGQHRRDRAGEPGGRAAVFEGRGGGTLRLRQRSGKMERQGGQVGADPAEHGAHHLPGAGGAGEGGGHPDPDRDAAGGMQRSGSRPERRFCGAGAGRGQHRGKPDPGPGQQPVLRKMDHYGRRHHLAQPGRESDREHRGERTGAGGTAGAGPGLCDRERQPGVGLQPEGEQHLCLRPGRPHQLVQLPGHCVGQLRGERGQRRGLYRCGQLHGLPAVLQGKLHPQAVRIQAQRLPALQRAVPGRGAERGPQPVRDRGDTVLPFAGRGDGLGREPAQQGEPFSGYRRPDGGGMDGGGKPGYAVLPVPAAERQQHGAAFGVRHREGPVAHRKRGGVRDGSHRAAALSMGRQCPVGGGSGAGNGGRDRKRPAV